MRLKEIGLCAQNTITIQAYNQHYLERGGDTHGVELPISPFNTTFLAF